MEAVAKPSHLALKDWGTWATWGVGPWHPFCIPQATEAVLQVALCFWGACNNPIWGWALISLCPLAHLIC